MPFKPFSLAESIQAAQAIKMNEMKLQAFATQQAREKEIRSLAGMARRPVYDQFEAELFPGEAEIPGLQEQVGEEFEPKAYQQELMKRGYIEEAADVSEQIARMNEGERKEAEWRTEQIGRLAIYGDTPEKWEQANREAMDMGLIDAPVPFEDREMIITQAQTTKDLLGLNKQKRAGYTSLQEVVLADEEGVQQTYKVPFDHRTGTYKWGEKILLSPKTPEQQARVAGLKEAAKVEAKERVPAKIDLPGVRSNARYLKKIVTEAISHPGFTGAVGAPGFGKLMAFVPGTEEADFMGFHKQITGKTFMQAYQTLKGGGQITEIEGQKATEALQRMDTARSEDAYREAALDFINEIDRLTDLAEQRATGREEGGWSIRKK